MSSLGSHGLSPSKITQAKVPNTTLGTEGGLMEGSHSHEVFKMAYVTIRVHIGFLKYTGMEVRCEL